MRHVKLVPALALLVFVGCGDELTRVDEETQAGTVTLEPVRDNTLYEDPNGGVSNGVGWHMFAGRSGQPSNSIRRALFAFDLTDSIPARSTIDSVRLTLNMSRASSTTAFSIQLHRLTSDWGEGDSDAPGEEGGGAPATPNDATWIHAFFDTDTWTTAGGDFSSISSAVQMVGVLGSYTWGSTPQMVADVQGWLDDPQNAHGWILVGDESAGGSSKRFDSKNHSDESLRPKLHVYFTTPTPVTTRTGAVLESSYR